MDQLAMARLLHGDAAPLHASARLTAPGTGPSFGCTFLSDVDGDVSVVRVLFGGLPRAHGVRNVDVMADGARVVIDGMLDGETLTGTTNADAISGFAGYDTRDGLAGNDVVIGGAGRDFMVGNDADGQCGTRVIVLDVAAGTATDTSGDPVMFNRTEVRAGSRFADVITGGTGNDEFWGDAGNDALRGGDGDDFLGSGLGNGTIDGGSGSDLATRAFDVALGGTRGHVASLATGKVTDTFGQGPTLVSTDNPAGSALSDTITGSKRARGTMRGSAEAQTTGWAATAASTGQVMAPTTGSGPPPASWPTLGSGGSTTASAVLTA